MVLFVGDQRQVFRLNDLPWLRNMNGLSAWVWPKIGYATLSISGPESPRPHFQHSSWSAF